MPKYEFYHDGVEVDYEITKAINDIIERVHSDICSFKCVDECLEFKKLSEDPFISVEEIK